MTPDVALIKLTKKVQFSSFVRPICLNRKELEKPLRPDQSLDRRRCMTSLVTLDRNFPH